MIFRCPAAPDPARRSKIDTFNKTRTRQHKQPEDHIARTRGHTGPSCNNTKGISKDNTLLKPYFTSVDATRHTEGKAVLNVVVAAASAAAAVVVVAVRQTDAQNGCLVGGWVDWLRRRRKKKKNGGGGDADVDDGEDFPNSIYTNSRSTASAADTGNNNNDNNNNDDNKTQ